MPRLAPPPPPVSIGFHHPYATLLDAIATALAVLDDQGGVHAESLAGIDFDLPPGTPAPEDRARIAAAGPLYFASELERAGLLPTAELIAGLFASGAITQPLGPTAQLLHDFWRGRRERLDASERNAIFARVIEPPHFDRLMHELCSAIVAQTEDDDPRARILLGTHAQALASFLAQRLDPMADMAARDIVADINTALVFLRDRMLQAAFAVTDLWRLVAIVAERGGMVAEPPQTSAERGRGGQAVLLWLSDHFSEDSPRLDPASPDQLAIIVAAQRWLASEPATAAPRRTSVGSALPVTV